MTAQPENQADESEESHQDEPQPEPVYDSDEAALVAERLEALGYIE